MHVLGPQAAAVLRQPGAFALRTLKRFRANQGLLLAGAVAYYALLSIVPLLILIVIALSQWIDPAELLQTLGRYLEWLVPGQSGAIVGELVRLGAVVHANVMEEVMARGMLEVLPLTHIRGRSLHDAFVIVDEAQSLERNVLLTVLSRIGQGSRVVLTHDVAQRDNLRVGRHDGVTAVIEALKGHPIFAHVTLTRSERSPIAEVVTDLLEEIPL